MDDLYRFFPKANLFKSQSWVITQFIRGIFYIIVSMADYPLRGHFVES